jgi:hypothetical protein
MKQRTSIVVLALVVGCASYDRHVAHAAESKWAKEALEFERTDVRAEVEARFRKGDLRFKGWVKNAADTVVFFPGVTE